MPPYRWATRMLRDCEIRRVWAVAVKVRYWQSSWSALKSDWPNERLQPQLIKHRIHLGIPIGLG